MRLLFLSLLFVMGAVTAYSQNVKPDKEIKLDVLKAPASPSMNMLGISPSTIERPTDLNAFMLSLQNASGNFSALPQNYGIEIAPYLMKKTGNTLNEFDSTKFGYVFKQSFQLSLGISRQDIDDKLSTDSNAYTKTGFGIKFSIIRQPFSDQTRKIFNDLSKAQKELLDGFSRGQNTEEIAALEVDAQIIRDSIQTVARTMPSGEERIRKIRELTAALGAVNTKKNQLQNEFFQKTDAYLEAKKIASQFKIERKKGGYLDFASGMVLDFPTSQFGYSRISKAGAWLTGGFDSGNDGFSVLGIARYLYQPDKIFADETGLLDIKNISTFDAGGRLLLTLANGRFILSSEAIYRSVLNKSTIDPSWRLDLNVEYDVGANQKLTFIFGRDFDGAINKGGNLIAALNFIKGFGSSRKVE